MGRIGRPCNVSNQEAILLFQKYMQYLNTNNFPPSSAKVWKDMSKELNGRWKPHSVYTQVKENKNKNLETARQNLGINIQPPMFNAVEDIAIEKSSEDSELDKSSYHDENEDDNVDFFPLVLSSTEWEQIKPDETSKPKKLKSWIWPNVITKAFWNMYKFPCAFLGKWSYVRMEPEDVNNIDVGSSDFYLKFKGLCKSKNCSNKIIGVADKNPVNGKLHLIIRTRDTRNDYHEEVKRPLNGPERKIIGRKLKRKRVAGYRQKLLAENMEFGDNEPPWVQKCHIYRRAKMECNKEDLGIKLGEKMDMITSIRNMLGDVQFGNTIRDIGAKNFYVFYCSPEQIFVEKEYCRIKKRFSRICLDATGKVVKKFEIFPGRKTGHIFLYTITINFEGKTLPVYQMLSEKHDAAFITFWLQEWIRTCKATIPGEAIADLGRALLLAMCEAFNRMTLKEYVDVSFKWAMKDGHKTPQPFNTLIRADVAHLMAAVARWKCVKDLRHPVVKGFYLRSVALMIDCQTVQEFERVFQLTCIVALHPDQDDSIIISGKQISVFEARRLLEEYMSERGQIIDKLEISKENVEIDEEIENTLNLVEKEDEENLTITHKWIKRLISISTSSNQQKMECKVVNGFYFPEFIQPLERIAKEFPIWTAATFLGRQTHASTATQEGFFAEMKTRIFEGITLPCSAIRFLKEHINDLYSGANEVAAKLRHFNHNHRQLVTTAHTSEKELGSASQKPARALHSSAEESILRNPVTTSCLFDEPRFLFQKPTLALCLFDSELGNFLQNPTPVACTAIEEFQTSGLQKPLTSPRILSEKPKLILKKSDAHLSDQHSEFSSQISVPPPCSVDIESASLVQKPILSPYIADEETKSSLQKSCINMNFDFVSLLHERARMVNDSDLKSCEAWKGFINKNSFFVDVNNLSPEKQEESQNIQDTSQILSQLLDFENDNTDIIDQNLFHISQNINTHGFPTNCEQDKLMKNEATLTAELSMPKPIFTSTPLIDHDYTKLLDEKISTKLSNNDKENLNPKCKNKPAKVGFYFQSYPQIRFLNERLENGGKKGFLLKNGLKLGIIKVNNIAVDLQKTCGFDAIIHLLQFGALYDSQYRFSIQSSTNSGLKFVCKLMKIGPTIDVLRERIILLNKFYPIVKDPTALSIKPYKLITEDSITMIWKNLFCCSEPTEPSAIRSSKCNNPKCVSSLPTDIAYFETNIKTINTKGIQALQDAVLFNEHYYNIKCQQKNCPGTVTETTRPHFHIFIDLDTRTHCKKSALQCKLADVPVILNFIKQYRLIGVIEHIPGHFIGYCRKPSGRWLNCDDMKSNIEACEETTVITPIAAIYVAL